MAHYRARADAAHAELSAVRIRLNEAVRSAQSDQQVSFSCCSAMLLLQKSTTGTLLIL